MTSDPSAGPVPAPIGMPADRTSRIRVLNDRARCSLRCRILITAGVQALGSAALILLLDRVRTFDSFDADNDPYGEHDFGAFEQMGRRFFWKIDCYDVDLTHGSPDPADPRVTQRVLTLMLAEEY